MPWKAWAAFAAGVLAVVSSFVAYHPLAFEVTGAAGGTTTRYKVFEFTTPGSPPRRSSRSRARPPSGKSGSLPAPRELPVTLGRRAHMTLALAIPGCKGAVTVRYVTLGRERTTPFKLDVC